MERQPVLIIDYGLCNLDSVKRACEEVGFDAVVSDDPVAVRGAAKLILPGVGNFADASRRLAQTDLPAAIREATLEQRVPILGICLGMQLFATVGHESGRHDGLDLIPGEVKLLEKTEPTMRIPHVGWNSVEFTDDADLFRGVPRGSDYYFVHSYHFVPADPAHVLATTPYGRGFACAIRRENVFGVQFHPEKSQRLGLALLKNFLEL